MHTTLFRPFLGHHQAFQYKKSSKGRYNEIKYILYIYTHIFKYCKKTVTVQLGTYLPFVSLYLSLDDFCIDMPDDSLRSDRNLHHSCKARLK